MKVKEKTQEPIVPELETIETWQLNATHDTKSGPFATKDISGMIDETWIGHRDYRI